MKITGLHTTTPQLWKFKGFHFVRCTSSNDPPLSMAFAYNNPHNSNKVCRWQVLLGPCAGGESEAQSKRVRWINLLPCYLLHSSHHSLSAYSIEGLILKQCQPIAQGIQTGLGLLISGLGEASLSRSRTWAHSHQCTELGRTEPLGWHSMLKSGGFPG